MGDFTPIQVDGGGLVSLRPGFVGSGATPAGGFLEAIAFAVASPTQGRIGA